MIKKYYLLFILAFFNCQVLKSQKFNFQNFSVTDGIAQSQVYSLLQDKNGIIWIGTRGGGITCFDGKNFTTYTTEHHLGNNYINSMAQDSAGTIWIATNNGLTTYQHTKFKNYVLKKDANSSIIVNQLYINGSDILLATTNGLYQFKNNTFNLVVQNFNTAIRSVCVYNKRIYVAAEEGVYEIENNKATLLTDKYGITPRSITYLITDKSNKLFIATYGDGAYVYENKMFQRLDANNELAKTTVLHLFADDDNIWISTLNKGIACYSVSKQQYSWLSEKEGLCNNHIRCCSKDNANNYWMGSSGGGLSYYKGQQFIHYTLNANSKSNLIYSVYSDNNNKLWIGNSDNGVSIKEGNTFTNFNASNGFLNTKVKCISETKNHTILLGTDDEGLYTCINNEFKLLPEFKSKYIKHIYRAHDNTMWIATAGSGIYKITFANSKETKYSVEHFTIKSKGLLSDRITCLCEDENNTIWYGTDDNGLGLITNGVTNALNYKADAVRGIVRDSKDRLWVATANGLLCVYKAEKIEVKPFTKQDGLSSNNIYSIIIDNYNHILLGNEKGFDQVSISNELGINDVKLFGYQEGFVGVETTQNAVCKDAIGNVWFGTINGLTNYNMNLQQAKNNSPILHLNNIRLFYLPINTLEKDSTSYKNTFKELTLRHNENHVTFDFLGIYLNNPTKVTYQWKLEGLEKDWSPLSKQESVTYPNLSPGQYTFYIKAFNEDGVSGEPVLYNFTIKSPWWLQWWFTLLWLLTLIIAVIFFYKWRTTLSNKKLKQQQEEILAEKKLLELQQKTLRLQMNPHFMFNALNSIQNNIGGGNEQTARYYLAKYSKLMRMVLDNSRNNLITLDDEIKMLDNYLLLEKFSNNDSFDYTIHVNESIEKQEILIPPMIIQPFIENAVVHGMKNIEIRGKISISFDLCQDVLLCIVEDNGVGREIKNNESEHKSTALLVTQERLDLLQENKNYKTIDIIDLKDNFGKSLGTKISIKIPLQLH
jgi:ligand-binding sensor domain-containing protein